MLKLNLGSHNKVIGEDYINVDGLDLPNVDLVCDFNNTPFVFNNIKNIDLSWCDFASIAYNTPKDNSVDEIQMVEVLEHISFKNTLKVLKEIYRILKPRGFIHIGVPDCGKAMQYYLNGEVCDCVPHKSIKGDSSGSFKAKEDCLKCKGKGKINPRRWLFSFTGAQKHKFDAHLNIFTKDILYQYLLDAGFKNIEFNDDIYKLKVKCTK